MAFEGCFFFKDQCLCTGWNSSGTAFGIDVMQYIYVDEDRRDFNSQVDKMILSSGITVPVLFFYLQKMKSDSGFTWTLVDTGPWLLATTAAFLKMCLLMFSLEVDIEGMEFTPGEMDSIGSASDAEDHYSLQSGSSDGGYTHSRRLNARLS